MVKMLLSPRRRKAGLPPGTPVHIGEKTGESIRITVFEYGAAGYTEGERNSAEQCLALRRESPVTWVNVDGVHDVATVTRICEIFGIHPLVLEDIVNTDQRPKIEEYEGYLFITVKMVQQHKPAQDAEVEQVSLVVMDKLVLSFQERQGDVFELIRSRLRSGKGFVRRKGPDYLAYCLIDAIVDHYYLLLEQIEERIDPLEESAVSDPQPGTVRAIQALKRNLLYLRRSLWPMREMIYRLSREDAVLITDDTRIFLRDLYDHVIHVIEILEAYQEIVSGTMEIYLSSISNRMNGIMKVLTIISTIFIPLTFVAGIYGMNFVFMPELNWRWAYPATLGIMGAIALGMLRFFRRKKWI